MTRSKEEIGAGLAAPREARPIRRGERIHVVGAGGAGASAAALLALRAGAIVTGCDPGGPSPYTEALIAVGIPLEWEHRADHVGTRDHAIVDRLAVTKALTAVQPDHPELAAARDAGIVMEAWQQVIADAAATTGQRLVAVAGTHGKSTSTGWLVHVLVAAGRDPSAFVGALLDPSMTGGTAATARWGSGDAFVVEADEYAGNFDPYRPSLTVLLNAEWDHPDVFPDEEAVQAAFDEWLRLPGAVSRTLVTDVADRGIRRLLSRFGDWPGRVVRAGLLENDEAGGIVVGSVRIGGGLDVSWPDGERLSTDPLRVVGRHNAGNALLVATAARELGVPTDLIGRGLAGYPGVGRRMELKGEVGGVIVLDDYAHHPTAMAATIEAVREAYPRRRLWAVYEPLTFHRTAQMLDRFGVVLATADRAVIADIWAGRDPDTSITSATALANAVTERASSPATAPGSVEATADHVLTRVEPGDVVLVMGGGRSYVIAERLIEGLARGPRVRGARG